MLDIVIRTRRSELRIKCTVTRNGRREILSHSILLDITSDKRRPWLPVKTYAHTPRIGVATLPLSQRRGSQTTLCGRLKQSRLQPEKGSLPFQSLLQFGDAREYRKE